MSTATITVKSSTNVRRVVEQVTHEATTGQGPFGQRILQEASQALLDVIRRDYLTKSYGGTDSTGLRWKPVIRLRSEASIERHAARMGMSAHAKQKLRDKYRINMMIVTGRLLSSLKAGGRSYGGWGEIVVRSVGCDYAKYALGDPDYTGIVKGRTTRPAWPKGLQMGREPLPESYVRAIRGVFLTGIRDEIARRLRAA